MDLAVVRTVMFLVDAGSVDRMECAIWMHMCNKMSLPTPIKYQPNPVSAVAGAPRRVRCRLYFSAPLVRLRALRQPNVQL